MQSKTRDVVHRIKVIPGNTPTLKQSTELPLDSAYPFLKGVRIHPVNQYANQFDYRIGINVDGDEYMDRTYKNDFFASVDTPMNQRTRERFKQLTSHRARVELEFGSQGDVNEEIELDVVFELTKEAQ